MVKFLLNSCLCLSLIGCKSNCESISDKANQAGIEEITQWADNYVMKKKWEKESLNSGLMITMGIRSIPRNALKETPFFPHPFRQVSLIGDPKQADGVFLSILSYNGILVARDQEKLSFILNKELIEPNEMKLIGKRVAVICRPVH